MSLKNTNDIDIERHPELWSKEIVTAVNNLRKGKLGAKRKLKKFVSREITYEYYAELIERYSGQKKAKAKRELYLFGYPIKELLPVLQFFLSVGSIGIILSSAQNTIWVQVASAYLLLSYCLYHYSVNDDKQQKDLEIAKLKHKIYVLQEGEKSNKHIIELLEKELENTQNKR